MAWACYAVRMEGHLHVAVPRLPFWPSGTAIKAFCDLTESLKIAKTRRNNELEQRCVFAETLFALESAPLVEDDMDAPNVKPAGKCPVMHGGNTALGKS